MKAYYKLLERAMQMHPIDTGKITDNIYAVKTGTVNFFIYKKGGDSVCIDSGGYGLKAIRKELARLKIEPESISHIFLTHSDFDHAGGLALFPDAQIYMSPEEAPLLDGTKARSGLWYNPPIRRKYIPIHDNDTFQPDSIHVRAIATPGHTPGSMSFVVEGCSLFAGDIFRIRENRIQASQRYNMDREAQRKSIQKLAKLKNIRFACCAHSGYTMDFEEAMRDWK